MKFEAYPKYKDSGVEWLGEIPEHWGVKKVFNHFHAKKGAEAASLTKEYCGTIAGNYNVYSGQTDDDGVMGKISHFEFDARDYGCLLVTTVGAKAMSIKFIQEQFSLSQNCMIVLPRNRSYLMNFFSLSFIPMFSFYRSMIPDHMQASFRMDDLYQYRFLLPPHTEQVAITTFLDDKVGKIDEAIAQKEQLIQLLGERLQIIIQNAVTKGLNPNAPMKDSGIEWIGEIPEHWEVKKVKELFRLVAEPAPVNNSLELLSIYTDIGVRPRKDLKEKGNKASTTDGYWIVKEGDFIVNKLLAWMGAIGLSHYSGVTSPAYDILRKTRDLDTMFYHYLFRSKICISELKKHSKGIMLMRLRLYFDSFGQIYVVYPPHAEQSSIVDHIETQSSKIDQAITLTTQSIEKLKEYKATLINSAVTGKINVSTHGY
ncbi:restriction endonuclease subunit S [Akkermansiaceae bacterium]|nr:restriction endonuclease subunit S [Akkermansiaceae bacterium]